MSLQVVYLPYAVPITIPTSGGGLVDVEFDVNPNFGEQFVVEAGQKNITLALSNTSDSPYGIELTFSGNLLKADSFDAGTESTPSYAIGPEDTRYITISRGSGGLSLAHDQSSQCTISYTLSDGSTSEREDYITVFGPHTIASAIREVFDTENTGIGPTLEYKFAGNLDNTGSLSGYNATSTSTVTTSSYYTWLEGYAKLTDHIQVFNVNTSKFNASTDRTWFFVFSNFDQENQFTLGYLQVSNSNYLVVLRNDSQNNGPGYIRSKSTIESSTPTVAFSTSQSGATGYNGATPHSVERGSLAGTTILCVSFNSSNNEYTYMWRQIRVSPENWPTGPLSLDENLTSNHTFVTKTSAKNPSSVNSTMKIFNAEITQSLGLPLRAHYFAIVDSHTTNADFDSLLTKIYLN